MSGSEEFLPRVMKFDSFIILSGARCSIVGGSTQIRDPEMPKAKLDKGCGFCGKCQPFHSYMNVEESHAKQLSLDNSFHTQAVNGVRSSRSNIKHNFRCASRDKVQILGTTLWCRLQNPKK